MYKNDEIAYCIIGLFTRLLLQFVTYTTNL